MAFFRNTASQKFILFAFDATTNAPKTGDAGNITPYVSKDYGSVTAVTDSSATEMDATNAPGYYLVDATQGETDAEVLLVSGKSGTSNIKVIGAPAVIFPIPTLGVLSPTVKARTLDVSATGEAGVDWANVGSPTTTVDLSGTTIKTTQKVDVDTIKTNPVVNGGTVTYPSNATLASTTNLASGSITTVTGNVNGNVAGSVGSVTGAVGSVTGAVGSVTGNVGGNVTGSVGSLAAQAQTDVRTATGLASANLDTQLAEIEAETDDIAAVKAKTDNLPAAPASTTNITAGTITTVTNLTNAPTAGDLTATMKTSVKTQVTDALNVDTYAEPGQEAPAATNTLVKKIGYLFKFLRNKITQDATTLKVYADDASTVDHKATVSDDATTYTRGEIGTGP